MSDKSKGNLEKIILTGIGAMATSIEKAGEILDELIKRGELTVEQGKTLNEELKHTVKTTITEAGKPAKEYVASKIIQNLDKLTPDERAQIMSKLQELEKTEKKGNEAVENQG